MAFDHAEFGATPVLILPPTRRDGEVTRQLLSKSGLTCEVCVRVEDLASRIGDDIGAVLLTDAVFPDRSARSVLAALASQPTWSDLPIVLLARSDAVFVAGEPLVRSLTNVTILERPTSTR